MASTVTERLSILASAVSDLALAITEKGGTPPAKVSMYGDAIRALPADSATGEGVTVDPGSTWWPYCINGFVAPPECQTIGSSAFARYPRLLWVNLSQVSGIDVGAFASCTALRSVSGSQVRFIKSSAFYEDRSLTDIAFPLCEYIDAYSFALCGPSLYTERWTASVGLLSVNLPACTAIYGYAFRECHRLQKVEIPEATFIGSFGFYNCTALSEAAFPKVTSIGSAAFFACLALVSISFPACAQIGANAFCRCGLSGSGETVLSEVSFPTCSIIGSSAFMSCITLERARFPSCQSIYEYAFYNCGSLVELDLTGVSSVPSVRSASTVFSMTPENLVITVPSSLYGTWVASTPWSWVSSRISTVSP